MIWYDIPTSFPYRDFDEKLIWISVAYLHDESKSILKWSKHFWGDFLSQEYKALMGNDYLDVVDVKTQKSIYIEIIFVFDDHMYGWLCSKKWFCHYSLFWVFSREHDVNVGDCWLFFL